MSRRRRELTLGLIALLVSVPVAHAQDAPRDPAGEQAAATPFDDRVRALEARADQLREGRGAEASADAVVHARRAMSEARRIQAQRPDAADRALGIADAALRLGERLAARADARLALEEARTRLETALRRAAVARESLQRAMVERDAQETSP